MFTFQQVTAAQEMEPLYRFRYEVYCVEKRFLQAEYYPTGIESDRYDPVSAHFYAYREDRPDEIAGYFRLILFNEHGFPCENTFDLRKRTPDPEHTVELSRLIVAPQFRRYWQVILMGLVKEMYLYSLSHTVSHCYAMLEKPLLVLLQRIGIHFEIIGDEQWCYNTPNFPAILDAVQFANDLLTGAKRYHEYVSMPQEEPALSFKQ